MLSIGRIRDIGTRIIVRAPSRGIGWQKIRRRPPTSWPRRFFEPWALKRLFAERDAEEPHRMFSWAIALAEPDWKNVWPSAESNQGPISRDLIYFLRCHRERLALCDRT